MGLFFPSGKLVRLQGGARMYTWLRHWLSSAIVCAGVVFWFIIDSSNVYSLAASALHPWLIQSASCVGMLQPPAVNGTSAIARTVLCLQTLELADRQGHQQDLCHLSESGGVQPYGVSLREVGDLCPGLTSHQHNRTILLSST